jgi:hypothetical protein
MESDYTRTTAALQGLAEGIGGALRMATGRELGFALVVFDFDNPGLGNYVSNADRAGMVEALRETADRLEAGRDIPLAIGSA